jgi:hypothetical protein
VKKKAATARKTISVPVLRPPVAKTAKRKKRTVTHAVVALAVLLTVIILWQWNRSPVSAPAQSVGQAGRSVAAGSVTVVDPGTAPTAETTAAPGVSAVKSGNGAKGIGPIIAAVRITPSQPLATDPIKAEASIAGGDAEGVTFSYKWKVNDLFIPRATDNVLQDTPLKRRDRISVVATAFRDGVAGPSTESQTVVVHSLPPSLEMKIITSQIRLGQPVEIQLTGAAPDGEKVGFSLISPYVEGMTIDAGTGKILWTPRRVLKGKLPFGAAIADTDGNKTMKVFELDLGIEKGQ